MSTPWREAAGDKAAAAGFECTFIKQRARRGECDAYVQHDTWAARWPAPVKVKAGEPVDEFTIPFNFYNSAPVVEPVQERQAEPVVVQEMKVQPTEPEPAEGVTQEASTQPEPLKPALERPTQRKKGRTAGKGGKVLANGRDAEKVDTPYKKIFCQVHLHELEYEAWHNLTASAIFCYLACRSKAGNAAFKKKKDQQGMPVFSFTHAEAIRVFKMTGATFTASMQKLVEEGFIEVSRPSGTFDGKGIAQLYTLSGAWKTRPRKKKGNPRMGEIGRKRAPKNRFLSKSPLEPP
ncbi:hypothetical protein E4633_06515 [Geomonas terrae]|uniref:Uncharacterized protein n=1 Tax=Geomonas terrae TaxID=2562681 RepID=A0A4V3P0D4_9BACT|nr:hypothetical protein [Geomonas terrae]TGU75102.1 hypothetical protein E4633_06515 [Geomonas terrae]